MVYSICFFKNGIGFVFIGVSFILFVMVILIILVNENILIINEFSNRNMIFFI